MLNAHQTQLIMERHFKSCYNFWLRTVHNEREAYINAIEDVRNMKHDPFSPCGEEIDIETRDAFVRYREQDMGKR